MPNSIIITQATQNDLQDASNILIEATQWMHGQGHDNWHAEWWSVSQMEEYRALGELFMAKHVGLNVGTFCLMPSDPEFWPEKEHANDANYVHRVAIKREKAGQGIPSIIFDWCKAATREDGKPYLRLDCANRPKLIEVYARQGFEVVGTAHWQEEGYPPYNGVKMELKV